MCTIHQTSFFTNSVIDQADNVGRMAMFCSPILPMGLTSIAPADNFELCGPLNEPLD